MKKAVLNWEKKGRSTPPPHRIKQIIISEYQKKHNINIFIETGTFEGKMIEAQKKKFNTLYSIELSEELYEDAFRKFKRYEHIKIIHGDSGKILKKIIPEIREKAVIWLDSHFSEDNTARGDKDSPILEELNAILESEMEHVLLIDDARFYTGEGDYPQISELTECILSRRPGSKMEVKEDIIRIELK